MKSSCILNSLLRRQSLAPKGLRFPDSDRKMSLVDQMTPPADMILSNTDMGAEDPRITVWTFKISSLAPRPIRSPNDASLKE
jgi:hypothetical protein